MTLLTAPEQGAAKRTRAWLLLLGGLTLLVAVAAVWLAWRLPEISADNLSSVGEAAVEKTAELPVASTEGVEAPGRVTGVSQSTVDHPVDALVLEACSQFAAGATVAEFAAWFEAEVGAAGAEGEALFQDILLRALGQTCPEVIPTG